MARKLLLIAQYWSYFVSLFVIQKPLFLLIHHDDSLHINDIFDVIWNGISMDLSTAGYLTMLPLGLSFTSIWIKHKGLQSILHYYSYLIIVIVSIIIVCDITLFGFWKVHLDVSALFYLKSPTEALASISIWSILGVFVAILAISTTTIVGFRKTVERAFFSLKLEGKKWQLTVAHLSLLAILFVIIRGGVGVATMNVGRAYYSSSMLLNQSAVNPVFNFLYSLSHQEKEITQFNFLTERERDERFSQLMPDTLDNDFPKLLKTDRPNIILIVLESFSAKLIEPLGGLKGITPNINQLSKEGILFSHFYANSFRTDRGLTSIISAIPSLPSTPLMKYPAKLNNIPSISGALKKNGYDVSMLYGGDLNFANMKQYFVCSSVENNIYDIDFPVKDRISKWGVPDHITFPYLAQSIKRQTKEPFLKMFLTLSSHEPFEVPFHKFEDKYINSVAYTDSCLGAFISGLKHSPRWDNTLVIMLSDHSFLYPESLSNENPERYHIPMLWVGGALKKSVQIDTLAAQSDLAATLLSQLNIEAKEFKFSRNMLLKTTPKFAFFSYTNGFGVISNDGSYVFDCDADREVSQPSISSRKNESIGKTFLQTLQKDFNNR